MFNFLPMNNRDNNDLSRGFNNLFSLFNTDFSTMRTDIQDLGDKFLLTMEIPGVDKSDIKINIKDNILNVSVDSTVDEDKSDESGNYIHRERSYQSASRNFAIEDIKKDEITAEFKNGLLKIDLPKENPDEAEDTHEIEIK